MTVILNALKKFKAGVHVPHHKGTENLQTQKISPPKQVVIPMQQHIGAPCEPVVKKKDIVKIGQVIGDSETVISAPIHAPISGKVKQIKEILLANGQSCEAIVIENDFEDALFTDIAPQNIMNQAELIQAARQSGLVGIGGAGFPLHVKLNTPADNSIDTLIINGAECEPFITSDYREMMEHAGRIVRGVETILMHLDIPRAIIGIENNKPQAIDKLRQLCESKKSANVSIEVMALPAKYPQGAEKMLIYATTGRKLGVGKLPADIHCIVLNVSTISLFQHYLDTSQPLTTKRLTIDGDNIQTPQNLEVPIGMKIEDILDFCGGLIEENGKIILGGPMMGIAQYSLELPITKQNNALLAFTEKSALLPQESPCIRCGRCGQACPLFLMPMEIERAVKIEDAETLKKLHVLNCMECGCCSFSCPAGRKLVQYMRQGKVIQREGMK